MKLKLPSKKSKTEVQDVAPVMVAPPAETKQSPKAEPAQPKSQLFTDDNGQRRVNTNMFAWAEVFSSKDKDLVDQIKMQFGRKLISSYLVFDFETKDYVLMTTETFYSEARRVVLELGNKPWGVEDE